MAEQEILKMGNPILREIAEPIKEFNTPELSQLIEDMKDTMIANDGVGLAAIQIGILKRVIIFGFEESSRYPQSPAIPMTVLINPSFKSLETESEPGWEGCLSIPGMRGLVPRSKKIQYSGYDFLGKKITREVSDFHARVFQHELDHLDGLLYIDKIENYANFGFTQELESANAY